MRTYTQIVERLRGADDFFGFDSEVLLEYLPFRHAKPFLKPEAKQKDWGEAQPRRAQAIEAEARKYMEFAWGKAEDHRGISASRSVTKMTEWLWLLGKDDLVGKIERDQIPYRNYGAPILKAICEEMGWPIPDSKQLQRMMEGRPCREGEPWPWSECDEGCDR